jgi:hypothetical protein
MQKNPEFILPPEQIPQLPQSRLRKFGSRILDFINPGRIRRREELGAQLDEQFLPEEQVTEQAQRDTFLAYLGEAVVVTTVIGANELHFTSKTGDAVYEPAKLSTSGQATRLSGTLTDIYLGLGSGVHSLDSVAAMLDLSESRIGRAVKAINEVLPGQIFAYETTSKQITLGNIALASRKATKEERDKYRERAMAAKVESIADWKERHNKRKADLTEYDHALAVTARRRFYLPLDSSDSILATRILSELSKHEEGERLEGLAIARSVWAAMPTMERELFTTEESKIVGKESAVDAQVLDILYGLTGRMGMTREVSNATFRVETKPEVSFKTDPIDDAHTAILVPVFPPGTPRRMIEDFRSNKVLPEHVAMARHALNNILKLPADTRMEDEAALSLLSFIMSREGKRALRAELESSGSRRKLDPVVKSLRRIVRTSLGTGYGSARRARTIGGNRIGKRVRQVSGGLPAATTKWYIGIKGAEEEGHR